MWEAIVERIPNVRVLFCAFMSAAVPYVVFIVNRSIHNHGDPPWKKEVE